MAPCGLKVTDLLGGHPRAQRLERSPPRRREHAHVDPERIELDKPAVAPHLPLQLAHARSPRPPPEISELAGLARPTVQQRVQLAAALGAQLVRQQPVDMTVRLSASRRDYPDERLDGRTQHTPGTEVLACQRDQRRRDVVFDRPLLQPPLPCTRGR